ncbi:DUF262 domain-containing protein [Trichocoleus sp. FACHB-90]|uniref:GmrSD restriction endonuclease domain-containing protein n=1 Tax=Cyanophyceae TaxID=3028117 RepID=UPI001682594A|nr:DUF262 domain-containing protein [Trichocoleus sp. FACHB-90]MBD1925144.1 DUF262 domain-containing protein [Trichocoleus sp. FACHB-90]
MKNQRLEVELEPEDEQDESEYEAELIDFPVEQRGLLTESKDFTTRELHDQFKEGDLILNPSFQRQYVFDDKKASRLIESLLMDVPLPIIYLSQEAGTTKNEVIDGQQRLTSFMNFFDGKFSLKGLTVFKELNGKKYIDLPNDIQSKIRKSTLRCIIIKPGTNKDIKFDIFERLNSGSVQLNRQELRNCIYRGSYSDLLRELALEPQWLKLIGAEEPHRRMLDCEMILRFFAFYHSLYAYKAPMNNFLNNEASVRQNTSKKDIKSLRQIFNQSVKISWTVFGEQAFKKVESGSENQPNARFSQKINLSIFDVVMVGFTQHDQREIILRADAIRNKLYDLMTTNQDFIEAILYKTSEKNKVQKRFRIWLYTLDEIIGSSVSDLRLFSYAFRKKLYEDDQTCSICGQRIMSLEDSVVDHTIPYSLGGTTEPDNGRLTHRYCNFARGNR